MDISIVIPIYNVAPYIVRCLESVARQTVLEEGLAVECLLVDDCGQDSSMDRAASYVADYRGKISFRILHHQHNRGLSAARNTGLAEASGRYVLFVDSDDELTSDCLSVLYAEAERTTSDVTVGEYQSVDEDSAPIAFGAEGTLPHLGIAKNGSVKQIHEPKQAFLCHSLPYMMAWNKLCRRDFLLSDTSLKFVEGLVHEDNPWSLAVALKARSVTLVQMVTYRYRIRENSLQTDKNFDKHYGPFMQIMQIEHALILAHDVSAGWWLDRQQALFFGQTKKLGTKQQQRDMYHLIRKLRTMPKRKCLTRVECHYLMPEPIGFWLYGRLYGNKLM